MPRNAIGALLSLVGAVIGASVGILIFSFLIKRGFYAMVVPGACLGLGSLALSQERSTIRGILFGIAGLALGLGLEWQYFHRNDELLEFLKSMPSMLVESFMIALGGVFAFWWGRDRSPWLAGRPSTKAVEVK